MEIAIGILLIISAVFLVVAVLLQHGKSHNLSGTIAGGAETFFGKTKGSTLDKKLSKLTTIVAVFFCALVLISYLMQDTTNFSGMIGSGVSAETTVDTSAETSAEGEVSTDGDVTEETASETEAAE